MSYFDIEAVCEESVAAVLSENVDVAALKLPIITACSFEDMMGTEATSEIIRVRCNEAVQAISGNGRLMAGVYRARVMVDVFTLKRRESIESVEQKLMCRERISAVRAVFMDDSICATLAAARAEAGDFNFIGFEFQRYFTDRTANYLVNSVEFDIVCSAL